MASVTLATRTETGDLVDRAVDATLACIARTGLSKLTVDDVARAAGASRATIYRAFPSKSALVTTTVTREADRVAQAVRTAASGAATLEDAVTTVILVGVRELRASAALQFVVAHEPERLLPYLSFAGGDRLYRAIALRLAPVFAPWCPDPERAAEWVARVGLCLLLTPRPMVDVDDAGALRRFVSTFVTPGLAGPVRPSRFQEV
jgi:AcrR family transcriptional regulator